VFYEGLNINNKYIIQYQYGNRTTVITNKFIRAAYAIIKA